MSPRRFVFLALGAVLQGVSTAAGAPAEVDGINRAQTDQPDVATADRLRIWIIDVGQGDALLIELPSSISRELGSPAGDPVNILIDGGATPTTLAVRTPAFLHRLYGAQNVTIEHMILTHHDRDHIVGLTKVLEDDTIEVQHVYGSGLAAFKRGVRDIPKKGNAGGFIGDAKRSLGRFKSNGELEDKYLVGTLSVLKKRVKDGELASDYGAFASAIANKKKPVAVSTYQQACMGCAALEPIAAAATANRPAFKLTTIWPPPRPRKYADWGKTTNGNSVAFRLDYGEFSVLFTGDLNEQSEPDVVAHLKDQHVEMLLNVDVLKAAHHGSRHNADEFLKQSPLKPALSVASMGSYGFAESNYKHPDEGIIATLGGPMRFYSTYIHERQFVRAQMSANDFAAMAEDTHVLIESDGTRFRIVEVGRRKSDPVLAVADVEDENGTLWIAAH